MRYFGGKAKIAPHLVAYLQTRIAPDQAFVDLFCGSCNVLSRIQADRKTGCDIEETIICTMKAARDGAKFPDYVSEDQYQAAKSLDSMNHLKGFILYGCSFSGKFAGGYARDNRGRSYALEAKRSLERKAAGLQDAALYCCDYTEADRWTNLRGAVIYCDIPYHGKTGYQNKFDHDRFYNWVASQEDCLILISEYKDSYNPLGLPDVWEHESIQGMRNKEGIQNKTVEVLREYVGRGYTGV